MPRDTAGPHQQVDQADIGLVRETARMVHFTEYLDGGTVGSRVTSVGYLRLVEIDLDIADHR